MSAIAGVVTIKYLVIHHTFSTPLLNSTNTPFHFSVPMMTSVTKVTKLTSYTETIPKSIALMV